MRGPLKLDSHKQIGSPNFLDRRELGIVNLGGAGRVHTDGEIHDLGPRDALYVAMGTKDVRFESRRCGNAGKILSRQHAGSCRASRR